MREGRTYGAGENIAALVAVAIGGDDMVITTMAGVAVEAVAARAGEGARGEVPRVGAERVGEGDAGVESAGRRGADNDLVVALAAGAGEVVGLGGVGEVEDGVVGLAVDEEDDLAGALLDGWDVG